MSLLIKARLNSTVIALLRLDEFYNSDVKSPLFSQFGSFEQLTWHDIDQFGESLSCVDNDEDLDGLLEKRLSCFPLELRYTDINDRRVFKWAYNLKEIKRHIFDNRVDDSLIKDKEVKFYGHEIPYFD